MSPVVAIFYSRRRSAIRQTTTAELPKAIYGTVNGSVQWRRLDTEGEESRMVVSERCAGEPPTPVNKQAAQLSLKTIESRGNKRQVLTLPGSELGVAAAPLVDVRSGHVAGQSRQDAVAARRGRRLPGLGGGLERLEAIDHPPRAQPGALPVEERAGAGE